jgi:hypothetical protein
VKPSLTPWRPPDPGGYSWLLGFYLGDGCIAISKRTHQLRIVLDGAYPAVIDECSTVGRSRSDTDTRVRQHQHRGAVACCSPTVAARSTVSRPRCPAGGSQSTRIRATSSRISQPTSARCSASTARRSASAGCSQTRATSLSHIATASRCSTRSSVRSADSAGAVDHRAVRDHLGRSIGDGDLAEAQRERPRRTTVSRAVRSVACAAAAKQTDIETLAPATFSGTVSEAT